MSNSTSDILSDTSTVDDFEVERIGAAETGPSEEVKVSAESADRDALSELIELSFGTGDVGKAESGAIKSVSWDARSTFLENGVVFFARESALRVGRN